jgi:hypothetical protein
LNVWVLVFFTLFYSSVHNINYAVFRVNNVHSLHHRDIYTNIGPDVCDVMFGSKNPENDSCEITNHYIPNIIIITFILLFLQYICKKNDYIKNIFIYSSISFLIISYIFLILSSIYLHFVYL